MIKAIIVDDELSNIENLLALVTRHCPQVNIIGTATNNQEAAGLINLHQPNLVFLDIQLSGDSGLNLLKLVQARSFEVIFVTAYDQYGIQAVKLAALDYLLKPVDIDELVTAVNKAEVKLKAKQDNRQIDFLLSFIKKEDSQPAKIALQQQK